MIGYIEGRITESTDVSCIVVTTSGVGYEVYLPVHTLARCKEEGGMVRFFVCTVVREDALELFGFESWDERQTFLILRTINRVGARTASAILSVFRPNDLRTIVLHEDVNSLTQVSGIGKKSAQQIFLELKYKMSEGPISSIASVGKASGGVMPDAVAALLNLGYAERQASLAVKTVLSANPSADVGSVLRGALKELAKG